MSRRSSRERVHGALEGAGARARRASPTGRAERSGIGRLIDLARRAGNQALERVLGGRHAPERGGAQDEALARVGALVGADVSRVRVSDDAESHEVAASLGAKAVTIGDRVLLGAQAPPRSSPAGERLLAHELAHVVQQREAGAGVRDAIGERGDAHERAAERAAAHATLHARDGEPAATATPSAAAAGAPAVVQREELAVHARAGLTRAEARARIEAYLERVREQQGQRTVSMTAEVKTTLSRMFLNDVQGLLRFDAFLGRRTFPGEPSALAEAIVAYLPDPVPPDKLAHLEISARPSPKTRTQRVGDLVKKTEPYVSPESQAQQWEFDRMTKEARKGDPSVVGPYGVDLQRVWNVGRGLPGALAGEAARKPAAAAAPNAAVEAEIKGLDADALRPAATIGTADADAFADAREVARALARDLEGAAAAKRDNVELRLGANYAGARDRERILGEVERISRLMRDALPGRASGVRAIVVYFGDRIVRRIPLAEAGGRE